MSVVTHCINGNYYDYEHKREGNKVRTHYIGKSGNGHHVVVGLKDEGFRDQPGYRERHEYANQKEKEKFGEERFNELQKVIQERLEAGELAGKYDEHNTYRNEKIPDEFDEEIRYHEEQERLYHMKHSHLDGRHRHDQGDVEGLHNHPQYEYGAKGQEPIRSAKGQRKFAKVMREYYGGKLFTKGRKVTDENQAKAIAASEARRVEISGANPIIREDKVQSALKHPDKPGAGAERRRELNLTPEETGAAIMKEYHRGTLYSGSGQKVKSEEQAKAIVASEARKAESE